MGWSAVHSAAPASNKAPLNQDKAPLNQDLSDDCLRLLWLAARSAVYAVFDERCWFGVSESVREQFHARFFARYRGQVLLSVFRTAAARTHLGKPWLPPRVQAFLPPTVDADADLPLGPIALAAEP